MTYAQEEPGVLTRVLRLAETLVMLAAIAEEQVAWCRRHGWCEDELALDFDWARGWVVWSVDEQFPGLLSPRFHDLLERVDDRLAMMSGEVNAAKWTPSGLATDPDWVDVRCLARQALAEITGLVRIPSPEEWESRYPYEWMAAAKSWGMKGAALQDLTMALPYLPAEVIDQLARLVCLAVRREHRCEDVRYAVLARAIGGVRLRPLLAGPADDPIEIFRLRARYLLWLLDHPDLPKPKKSQWMAWLKDQGKY